MANKALASGAELIGVGRVRWNISGNCETPHVSEIMARPDPGEPMQRHTEYVGVDAWGDEWSVHRWKRKGAKRVVIGPGRPVTCSIELHTRCRKCDKCRAARAALWRARATAETSAAYRTWFGTLTLSPDAHIRGLSVARQRLRRSGIDYDALDEGDKFAERHRSNCPELTKYLKRLRKVSGAPFRFLLVAEAHVSGLPHYHMLVHEVDADKPVRYALLREQWKLGFSKWNLVSETKQATYLCKYLSKASVARVRASLRYGDVTGLPHSPLYAMVRGDVTPPLPPKAEGQRDGTVSDGRRLADGISQREPGLSTGSCEVRATATR